VWAERVAIGLLMAVELKRGWESQRFGRDVRVDHCAS
jgi:hypothetical protein